MIYFVTGAGGFIGKRLVRALLSRPDTTVYVLMRKLTEDRLAALRSFWGSAAVRAIPLEGDITKPGLGLSKASLKSLKDKIGSLFHLAAVYVLEADPTLEFTTNIEGTRNVIAFARSVGVKRFHHMSWIAAAGLYEGGFREDMFEEARNLDDPYFASKHGSEKVVREECPVPWRIYRPGIVVGDSRTGEMDKIDGPYYFFKLIQKLRKTLPRGCRPSASRAGGSISCRSISSSLPSIISPISTDTTDAASI